MNQEKENAKDASKKMCPKAARENARKKTSDSRKLAHTGLRFHFDRKKLVTHEFNFNSVSKTEKIIRCRSEEKTVEKPNNDEGSNSTDSDSKKIKVLMDTLKISRSEESSSREKSPFKSPVVERLTTKKDCSKCSRCSSSRTPKEVKPEIKPLKVAKNQDQPLKITKKEIQSTKTVKLETPLSPKAVTCKKQCSKLAKLLAEPQEKTLKPKSILKNTEKSICQDTKKKENSEISNTDKPCSADKGKPNCTNEEKPEFWPKSGNSENVTFSSETSEPDSHDKDKSVITNGSEFPGVLDTSACLLNGSRHDEHICDPHFGHESSDGAKKELESVKSASKIPRKTQDAPGSKSDASLNKVTIPQPFSFDLGSQNMNIAPADVVNVAN